MCGRYYVDDETVKEIKKLVWQIDDAHGSRAVAALDGVKAGDVFPGCKGLVLSVENGTVCCGWQQWGFLKQWELDSPQNKKLVINARSESVMEKPMFCESILHNRIVIPAAGFYEWNARREKSTFRRMDASVLFMAGCARRYEDGMRFVILTTLANATMEQVHDRMPLILEPEEAAGWLLDDAAVEGILRKTPCLLGRETDYEQMSLF